MGKSENSPNFMATNPQEDSNDDDNSSSADSADNRFDIDDPFKDMECTNVFVDEDEKERLPHMFNPKIVRHIKRDDCYLCHEQVSKMNIKDNKKRYYCTQCGKTVCKNCC